MELRDIIAGVIHCGEAILVVKNRIIFNKISSFSNIR